MPKPRLSLCKKSERVSCAFALFTVSCKAVFLNLMLVPLLRRPIHTEPIRDQRDELAVSRFPIVQIG